MIDINEKPRRNPDGSLDVSYFLNVLCADKWWRINNLYWIKDQDGNKIKFRCNEEQTELFNEMHRLNVILKARQLGFTTFIQIYILDECLFTPNISCGVIAHTATDATAFFDDKIKFAYDNLAEFLKKINPAKNDSAKVLSFSNGSRIIVSTSLRSGTYQIIHVSEYGKLCAARPDRAAEVRNGSIPTVHNTGHVFVESTAEGRTGLFFDICETAKKQKEEMVELTPMDFKFFFFPWWKKDSYRLDAPVDLTNSAKAYFEDLKVRGIELNDAQKAWYVKQAKLYGDSVKREYPSYPEEAFEAAMHGAYFARQMAQVRAKSQILRIPIDPYLPISTFWDLGRNTTAIWFMQKVGFEYRFIDYFQASGEDIIYYVEMLKARKDGDRPYKYDTVYLPHDGDRKNLQSKHSVADILRSNGFDVKIVRRTLDKHDLAIETARRVLPMCYFDRNRCAEGIKCLDSYRCAWDDKLGDWRKEPVKDGTDHGADAFMTFSDGMFSQDEIQAFDSGIFADYAANSDARGRNAMTGY